MTKKLAATLSLMLLAGAASAGQETDHVCKHFGRCGTIARFGIITDSPYTFVEIKKQSGISFNGMETYKVTLTGNAQQYSFEDQVQIEAP